MKIKQLLLGNYISQLELMAEDCGAIFWAATPNYNRLLFVSSNYSSVWGRSSADIYRDLSTWRKHLISEHQDSIYDEIKQRNTPFNPNHTKIYCIKKLDNTTQWILDRTFTLYDNNNFPLMLAGIALPILEAQRFGDVEVIDKVDVIILKYYNFLVKDSSITSTKKPSLFEVILKLTRREKEILEHLLYGLTAKQIAANLHISERTVEVHVDSIKGKLGCKSKSEIIMMAIENNWINVSF